MKRLFILSCCLSAAIGMMAIPAKRVTTTFTQSDGTSITVTLTGDEFHHSFLTQDGITVGQANNGDFYYRNAQGLTGVMAHNSSDRSQSELSFVNSERDRLTLAAIQSSKSMQRRSSARRGRSKVGATQVPTAGSPRVPVLLVQYSDKKMSNSKATFVAQYTQGSTSVHQYFSDQSNGKYNPQFDVYGIYTLNSTRATYGGNDSNGNDKGVAKMVGEAIDKAGNDIDWSKYDNDGDGEADVCIVVYAGPGEAQGATSSSIWPCQWSLSSGAYYNDGTGARMRNNTKIDRFAVFNETNGSSDSNTQIDGIGTFCHEFSHCLGLPDFYETTYSYGYYGIGSWSLMDYGSYNNNGYTPIGYSAYEKNFMGWIDYDTPSENTQYTLPVFNQKNASTDRAVRIVSPLNSNEYFILENRQQQGWDQYIKDEGLMITHVTYVADRWNGNTVNNKSVQLFTIIPADNTLSTNNETTDLYGQTNHAFTSTSTPASKLNMKSTGALASTTGGAGTMDKPVTDININSDGTVSFWYVKGENPVVTPTLTVTPNGLAFGELEVGKSVTKSFTMKGTDLTGNVNVTLSDANGVFSIDKTSVTATAAKAGATITVTFKPTQAGTFNGTVTLASAGANSVKVTLSGSAAHAQLVTYAPVMLDAVNATSNSFRAEWTDQTSESNVSSYTLWLNEIVNATPDNPGDPTTTQPELLQTADFSTEEAYTYWGTLWNVAKYYNYFLPSGWTTGRYFYVGNGCVIPGNYIKTNRFSMPNGYNKVSVVIHAFNYTSSTASLTVSTLYGGGKVTKSLTSSAKDYTFVLNASATDQINIAAVRYPGIVSIKIYAGDVTAAASTPRRAESARQITGITSKYYDLTDLTGGNTYQFKVKALYSDGTESAWSNQKDITLDQVKKVIAANQGLNLKAINNVKFYDLQGRVSNEPTPGINIVVTTYEDGTTSTEKVLVR